MVSEVAEMVDAVATVVITTEGARPRAGSNPAFALINNNLKD